MSYVLRYIYEQAQIRRGKRNRLVYAIVCYADDFTIYGDVSKLKKAMKKATIWAHDKFGLKIKDIWQFYQVASFDEERENLEERRKGSKKRTPGVDDGLCSPEEIHDHPWESISENPEASAQSLGRFQGERIYPMVESLPDCSIQRLDKA